MTFDPLGVIVGIIGVFLAFYFYFKGRREKNLVYVCSSILVVSRQLPADVSVSFKGDQVNILFISRVSIWNQGNEPIRKEDISPKDPLIITFRGRILSLQGIESSRHAIGSQVTVVGENEVVVTFDFLDKNDGVSFSVLTDCDESEETTVGGTIIGMPKGIVFSGKASSAETLQEDIEENRSIRKALYDSVYYLIVLSVFCPSLILLMVLDSSARAASSYLFLIMMGVLYGFSMILLLERIKGLRKSISDRRTKSKAPHR